MILKYNKEKINIYDDNPICIEIKTEKTKEELAERFFKEENLEINLNIYNILENKSSIYYKAPTTFDNYINIILYPNDFYLKNNENNSKKIKDESKQMYYFIYNEINKIDCSLQTKEQLYSIFTKTLIEFPNYLENLNIKSYKDTKTIKDLIDKEFLNNLKESNFLFDNDEYLKDLLLIKEKIFNKLEIDKFENYNELYNEDNITRFIKVLNNKLKNSIEKESYSSPIIFHYFKILNESNSKEDFIKKIEDSIFINSNDCYKIEALKTYKTQINKDLLSDSIYKISGLYFVKELKNNGYNFEEIKNFSKIYKEDKLYLKEDQSNFITFLKHCKNIMKLSSKEKDVYKTSNIPIFTLKDILEYRVSENKIFSKEYENIFHFFEDYTFKIDKISNIYENYPQLLDFYKKLETSQKKDFFNSIFSIEEQHKIFSYLKNNNQFLPMQKNLREIYKIVDFDNIYEEYVNNLNLKTFNCNINKEDKFFIKTFKETFNFLNTLEDNKKYNFYDNILKDSMQNLIIRRLYESVKNEEECTKKELINTLLLKENKEEFLESIKKRPCFETDEFLSKEMIYESFLCMRKFSIEKEKLNGNSLNDDLKKELNQKILKEHKYKFEDIILKNLTTPFEAKNTDLMKMFKENNATGRRIPGIINELEYLVENDLCKANDIVNDFKGKINIIRDKILPLGNPSLIGLYMMGLDFGQLSNDKIETLAFCSSRNLLPKMKILIPILNESLNNTPNEIIIKAMETLKIINNKEIINNINNLEELTTLGLEIKCNNIKNWYEKEYNYNFSNYECEIKGPRVPNIFSEEYKNIEQRNQLMENLETIVKDDYKAGFLTNNDILAFIVGDEKDGCACCEKPNEPGESCIYHATSNPNSGTFVIQRLEDDKMMAQAFTIYDEKTDTLIFDNIEFSNNRGVEQFITILQEFAKSCPYENIQLGMKYTIIDIGMPIESNDFIDIKNILNSYGYSDYNIDARFLKKEGELTITHEDIENYREKQEVISLCN